jgi:double-strand break repair protein MRE11
MSQDTEDPGDDAGSHNTLRILVATDNHLGYMEKDPIRGNDSFVTFEEILQYAQKEEVDMVLLGGDLFHDNKPSRATLYRTMELLRKYCMGDRPVKFQLLSDQSMNFKDKFATVNYEDPNYNIAIPIFSIHGNHDDPAGDGSLAALDILAVSNMINYFGKSENVDDVTVYPLLINKGDTNVAIYGLGNIRDERLYRTFQQKKVKLMRPVESDPKKDKWFNIFILHQNRVAHSPKNYIHEVMLDNFLDFVIWGHEHECLIKPQPSAVGAFYITQPGSSVATSLSEGESKRKHIGLLEIHQDRFRLKPIPLQTVRPFVMSSIVLADELDPSEQHNIMDFLEKKVIELIQEAEREYPARPGQAPLKPLIRLKVDYSGFSTVNPQRFGQRFVGKIANPNDILLFHRKRASNATSRVSRNQKDEEFAPKDLRPEPLDNTKVEDLIESFLGATPSDVLEILPEADLHVALHSFVEKDEKNAIADFVKKTLRITQNFVSREDPSKTLQPEYIHTLVMERTAQIREKAQQERGQDHSYHGEGEGEGEGDEGGRADNNLNISNPSTPNATNIRRNDGPFDDNDDDSASASDTTKPSTIQPKGKTKTAKNTPSKAAATTSTPAKAKTAPNKRTAAAISPPSPSTPTPRRGRPRGAGAKTKVPPSKYSLEFSDSKEEDDDIDDNDHSAQSRAKQNDDDDDFDDNDHQPPSKLLKTIKTEKDDENDSMPQKRRVTNIMEMLSSPKSKKAKTAHTNPPKDSDDDGDRDFKDNTNDDNNKATSSRTSTTTRSAPIAATHNWGRRKNQSQKSQQQ